MGLEVTPRRSLSDRAEYRFTLPARLLFLGDELWAEGDPALPPEVAERLAPLWAELVPPGSWTRKAKVYRREELDEVWGVGFHSHVVLYQLPYARKLLELMDPKDFLAFRRDFIRIVSQAPDNSKNLAESCEYMAEVEWIALALEEVEEVISRLHAQQLERLQAWQDALTAEEDAYIHMKYPRRRRLVPLP